MDIKKLKNEVNQIKMSKKMKEEILIKCNEKLEEKHMNKNNIKKFKIKPLVAVVALALCLCVTGITAMATTGKLEGYFKDIKNFTGTVTGTAYEQATDEVKLSAHVENGKLKVELVMVQPNKAPYMAIDNVGIESYQIVDSDNHVIFEGKSKAVEITSAEVEIEIALDNIAQGEYKLVVTKLVGSSKADQPLIISGNWESSFVY